MSTGPEGDIRLLAEVKGQNRMLKQIAGHRTEAWGVWREKG